MVADRDGYAVEADIEKQVAPAAWALFESASRELKRPRGQESIPSAAALRRMWDEAFESWLRDSAASPRTVQAYTRAWADLREFCEMPPVGVRPASEYWQVTHQHIRAWIEDLATRELDQRRVKALENQSRPRKRGYAEGTINQYLAAISSFFSYAEHHWPVLLADGRVVALTSLSGIMLNPVGVIKRRSPGVARQREQTCLSAKELREFLRAIPRDTVQGLRDFALFSFYIMTGGRNTEVRSLTFGDFQERQGQVFWRCRGKGHERQKRKDTWKELPHQCWDALEVYLRAVGRWENLRARDFVFTALTDRAANLPRVLASQWHPHAQPLTEREVNRLVKRYAGLAGLDPQKVHVHTLRHSAAMLMDAAGAGVEEIREFLNHERLNTTQGYLHRLEGQHNVRAGKMAELLGL